MSDGKKFIKTDANLSPEDRLAIVERNFSVILERIQAYDQVLNEFANISSDLKAHKQQLEKLDISLKERSSLMKDRLDILSSKISLIQEDQEKLKNNFNDQSQSQEQTCQNLKESHGKFYRDIELLKMHVGTIDLDHLKTKEKLVSLEKSLSDSKKSFTPLSSKVDSVINDHINLSKKVDENHTALNFQVEQLISSFQELPQFNEWATKIYIKVCNEINDKQRAFYQELDKRSQLLKEQLASDPYTADSVRKILNHEIEEMALDGKNAYLKVTNATHQIQLLEKKIEKINLILKKYELSISHGEV